MQQLNRPVTHTNWSRTCAVTVLSKTGARSWND